MASNRTLDFGTYQEAALATDQVEVGPNSLIVPLLGLVGEVGTLAVEHKKKLRDGEKHKTFKDRIAEDLGDILWYVSNFASKNDLPLEYIARRNLHKIRARWALPSDAPSRFLDDGYKAAEQLPRHFVVEFVVDKRGRTILKCGNRVIGDPLTDNNYGDDGYRFHDVFHFAYAAVLGWSPVARGLLKCKRKSDPMVDQVEDGGRAAVTEEGVAALAFAYARVHAFLKDVKEVDNSLIETIQRMTEHLEVRSRSAAEWESAILQGFECWRALRAANSGRITVDLHKRQLFYSSLPVLGNQKVTPSKKMTKLSPRKSRR